MEERWGFSRFRVRIALLLVSCLLHQHLNCCSCLNAEGLALLKFREGVVRDPYGALSNWNRIDEDPCSWFGVHCSDGKVVVLNLKDLCLEGTLASALVNLIRIKSIVLRNNSFFGVIPKEIGELKELEVLDLGYNNFCGPLPFNLGNSLSLAILLIDNNRFLGSISSELQELNMLSELQVDEKQLYNVAQGACNVRSIAWNDAQDGDVAHRRLVQVADASHPPKAKTNTNKERQPTPSVSSMSHSPASSPSPSGSPSPLHSFISSPSLSPSLSPSPSPSSSLPVSRSGIFLPPSYLPSPVPTPDLPSPAPADPPVVIAVAPPSYSSPLPSLSESPSPTEQTSSHSKHRAQWPILSGAVGGSFLLISIFSVILCRRNKVVTVKPWTTGLSGQLQKAFVTGVPKLKRSELETACEDFSNIIGSSLDGTVYKGTLSSGVEIAVTSTAVASSKDWSKQLEAQFRKKISTLSKINHKNFVNLLGYCEEDERFTRMMVLEYAPNGTLFEHLHIKEAEHLDWGVRLRIAMGIAYCLEHMHQLTPPVIHKNLESTTVYLTEDYAAKISYHDFWNEAAPTKMELSGTLDTSSSAPESNVYSFGVILLEMITGRLPYSADNGPIVDWASEYLRREKPVKDLLDPTLKSFQEEQLGKLCDVIRSCIHANPKQRPAMREVTARLRDITALAPDGATPKLSPLWWAELEILSTEAT